MAEYITETEAQVFINGKLYSTAWDNATDGQREKALTMACNDINRLNFNISLDDFTTIPDDIMRALTEIAYAYLDGVDMEQELKNINITSTSYGNISLHKDTSKIPEHLLVGIPSAIAWRLLRPYLTNVDIIRLNRVS